MIVLTANDDALNVDAALAARRLRPDVPLVVRLFDEALGAYLRDTLAGVTFLSMSFVSAPVFAGLALRAVTTSTASKRISQARRRRPWRFTLDRVTLTAGLSAIILVVAATAYFARALDLRPIDALYFVWTTVFTVGYGDITPHRASDTTKVAAMLLMVGGAALIAILYALLSGWVVSRRLDVLRGHVPVRSHAHVIVAGAGNVGYRVARLLAEQGHRVVVVDRDADNRNLTHLRAAGHHVIVADATADETLELAGIERAVTVLALTGSDATNLHIILGARTRRPDLPIVTRFASPELSAHLTDRDFTLAASSIAIGSEAFAHAALAACGVTRDAPSTRRQES